MRDIIRQVKKHWKVLTALAVVLTVSVIGMTILFANDVVLTMKTVVDSSGTETDKTTWKMSEKAPSLKAEVSATSSDSPIFSVSYQWSSSEPEVMAVSAVSGTDKEVQLVFKGAGKTTITCKSTVTFQDGTQANKTVTRDFFILLEARSDTFQVKEV